MRDDPFLDFVLDQLGRVDGVTTRPMFGGHGLYRGGVFFGIVCDGRLYFKTDEASAAEYRKRGAEPFRPSETQTLKRYYEVPAEVVESSPSLAEWAQRAARCGEADDPQKVGRLKRGARRRRA
jgi:DNA transformation protein